MAEDSTQDPVGPLLDCGLIAVVEKPHPGAPALTYRFSAGVLPTETERLFSEYAEAVNRHERAVAAAIDTGSSDPIELEVHDRARSRRHNALAANLKDTLGLTRWSHEKVRQLAAAMVRPLIDPGITNVGLDPTTEDAADVAAGVARLRR